MNNPDKLRRFQQTVLPHLDAAHNLARWLTRNGPDAEDVVQEAMLRAFRFFEGFRGSEARPWLLRIVRNTFYTWREQNRTAQQSCSLEEEAPEVESDDPGPPELHQQALDTRLDTQLVQRALAELPARFREVLVLRELEDCSYKEIAAIMSIPMGTVMSRLARARQQLEHLLRQRLAGERP